MHSLSYHLIALKLQGGPFFIIGYTHPLPSLLFLPLPIIHKPHLDNLLSLRNNNTSHMFPLPINLRKSPNLFPRPPILLVIHKTLHEELAIRSRPFLLSRKPILLTELVFHGVYPGNPPTLPLEVPEEVIRVRTHGPVELAELRRAFDAAGGGLDDVDVHEGGLGLGVLLDMEGEGREADCFAGEPPDALEGENGLGAVGEGFVLRGGLVMGERGVGNSYSVAIVGEKFEYIPLPTLQRGLSLSLREGRPC